MPKINGKKAFKNHGTHDMIGVNAFSNFRRGPIDAQEGTATLPTEDLCEARAAIIPPLVHVLRGSQSTCNKLRLGRGVQ